MSDKEVHRSWAFLAKKREALEHNTAGRTNTITPLMSCLKKTRQMSTYMLGIPS